MAPMPYASGGCANAEQSGLGPHTEFVAAGVEEMESTTTGELVGSIDHPAAGIIHGSNGLFEVCDDGSRS